MKKIKILSFLTVVFCAVSGGSVCAQTEPAFPQKNGVMLDYRHYGPDGSHDADFSILLRNVTGDNTDGTLEMVYICTDTAGRPYFDGSNEYVMKVTRRDGQTYIDMDKLSRTVKMMSLISAGDPSAINVPMNVGDTLSSTKILSTLGIIKTTLTVSEKKVLDHNTVTVGGREFECWLVHEKIVTRTPFSTDVATADTWYAKGAGCVSQTVYDAKGHLKGKLELVSVKE